MHENEYQLADRFTGHPYPRTEPESTATNAHQSFISKLSSALTERQNKTLYDMLVDATLAQIKVEEFLVAEHISDGPAFDRAADTVSDLLMIRECLTSAQYGVSPA